MSPSPTRVGTSCSLLRDAHPTAEHWGPWEDSRREEMGLSENGQLGLRNRKGKELQETFDSITTLCSPSPGPSLAQALAERSATSLPALAQGWREDKAPQLFTHIPQALPCRRLQHRRAALIWSNPGPLHLGRPVSPHSPFLPGAWLLLCP